MGNAKYEGGDMGAAVVCSGVTPQVSPCWALLSSTRCSPLTFVSLLPIFHPVTNPFSMEYLVSAAHGGRQDWRHTQASRRVA